MIGVFPKGARFLLRPGPQFVSRTGPRYSFHIEAIDMVKRYENGPVKFLVETRTQEGLPMVRWVLDQRVSNVHDSKAWDRLYNQVQAHLSTLSMAHGTENEILSWGVPEDVDRYIISAGIEIH